ncbi:hypothetical protein [Hyphomicrobium sp.]|nr:hypothetical protein [Hyphomicrobium sp.]
MPLVIALVAFFLAVFLPALGLLIAGLSQLAGRADSLVPPRD